MVIKLMLQDTFDYLFSGGRSSGRASWSQGVGRVRLRAGHVRFRATSRNELPRCSGDHDELHRRLHFAVRPGQFNAWQKSVASQRRRWCGKFFFLISFIYEKRRNYLTWKIFRKTEKYNRRKTI